MGTAIWWAFLGCGALATGTAALARRTAVDLSFWLDLLTTLPLTALALIFAPVPAGWLAGVGRSRC